MTASRLRRDRRRPTSGEPAAPSPGARPLPVRRTALVRAAVLVALATGPLGLIASCARHDPAVPAQSTAKVQSADQTKASPDPAGYAELVLGLWLRAGEEDSAAAQELHALAPSLTAPSWGESAPVVERLAAVRSVRQSGTGWSVTVAVQFKESTTATDRSAAAAAGSGLRYFALPLVLKDTGTAPGAAQAFAVAAAPMEVTGPTVADDIDDPYGTQVPDASPLATTAKEFLTAYLGAEEGAERYLAPGITLPALASASFTAVQVDEIRAVQRVDGTVGADGTSVRVRVQITASDAGGGTWPLSYALTFTARDGRWEVTALQSGLESAAATKKGSGTQTGTVKPTTTDVAGAGKAATVHVARVNTAASAESWGTAR
ncbi:conjugal transfer protein [Streptomyces sp. TRM68367]|uniref:conjugal transfer protein n=1 Tax=Streptomyces sp. TRM68367 TaxID=2758415 RepID=UPI00165C663E|nr:conjugal transfer protein [Streptomyces sp. TRM68367]MBC9729306.1 conjugal transfer protein [Streptomyces sp. TRM68367]